MSMPKWKVVPAPRLSAQSAKIAYANGYAHEIYTRLNHPQSAQRIIKRVAKRAMISKPVSPHVLRHTFAVNCVKKGLSTASLKKILRHDRLETTEIYLNICPRDALSEFFDKVERTWHARLE